MTWSKLTDDFFRNPKIVRAGRDARDLYIVALCHCNEFLTDGLVETGYLRQLAAKADIDEMRPAVAALVRERLWEEAAGGWMVHDFLDYNFSRERVLADREKRESLHEKRAEAGRNGGLKSAEARAEEARKTGEELPLETLPEATPEAKGEFAQAKIQAKGEFAQAKIQPPVSRIPYPGIRIPDPPNPQSPPARNPPAKNSRGVTRMPRRAAKRRRRLAGRMRQSLFLRSCCALRRPERQARVRP